MSHINSSGTGGGGGGGGVVLLNVTEVTFAQSPYTVVPGDAFIGVDTTGGPVTIVFPTNPPVGVTYIVKDIASNADVNNITLTDVSGTDSFDNTVGSYVMNTENQSADLIYVGGGNYYIW